MPASYSWTLTTGSSSASGSISTPAVPFCRSRDPKTGELLFDKSRRTWLSTQSAIGEVILNALRTKKGTALRDASYGLDDGGLENQVQNADVLLRLKILQCVQRYVTDGRLSAVPTVTVTTAVTNTGETIYTPTVVFVDSRGNSGTISGRSL